MRNRIVVERARIDLAAKVKPDSNLALFVSGCRIHVGRLFGISKESRKRPAALSETVCLK